MLLVFLATPLIERNDGRDVDGVHYAAMAAAPRSDEARVAPFCWRILTPWIASHLPFSPLIDFRWLHAFSALASLLLLYDVLGRTVRLAELSLFGMLLYGGVFWTIKFPFYSPFYVEAETQFLLLLVIALTVRRKYAWTVAVLPIAVLQKESLVFLAPIVAAHHAYTEGASRRSLALLLALLVPSMVALVGVRELIEPVNRYSSFRAVRGALGQMLRPGFWPRFMVEIFSGLGVLPVLVVIFWREVVRFVARSPAWGLHLVVGGALLLGGVDKARLFLFMLPAVIVTATAALDEVRQSRNGQLVLWMGAVLLVHFYLGHHLTPMGSFAEYRDRMVPIHSPGSPIAGLVRVFAAAVLTGLVSVALRRRIDSERSD